MVMYMYTYPATHSIFYFCYFILMVLDFKIYKNDKSVNQSFSILRRSWGSWSQYLQTPGAILSKLLVNWEQNYRNFYSFLRGTKLCVIYRKKYEKTLLCKIWVWLYLEYLFFYLLNVHFVENMWTGLAAMMYRLVLGQYSCCITIQIVISYPIYITLPSWPLSAKQNKKLRKGINLIWTKTLRLTKRPQNYDDLYFSWSRSFFFCWHRQEEACFSQGFPVCFCS